LGEVSLVWIETTDQEAWSQRAAFIVDKFVADPTTVERVECSVLGKRSNCTLARFEKHGVLVAGAALLGERWTWVACGGSSREAARRTCGLVFQDPSLFDVSP
jgi:hypothetical protein